MNILKKHRILLLGAVIGFVLFWVLQYAPTLSGENAEATRHAISRTEAEQAAVNFVREKLGLSPETELRAFAVYSAEKEAFGYLYKEGLIQEAVDTLQTALPLELYRVEVKEAESGTVHLIDMNPYTGKAAEWQLSGDQVRAPLSTAELERIGRDMTESMVASGASVRLTGADTESGEVRYTVEHEALSGAYATVTVRADSSETHSVTVEWFVPETYTALAERQDYWSSLLGTVGLGLSAALQLAAIIYVLTQLKQVRFSRGSFMALVFAVFYCAININMYPGIKGTLLGILNGEAYTPASGDSTGLIAGLISALLVTNTVTLFMAIGTYFSAVAGDRLTAGAKWPAWPSWINGEFGQHLASSVWKGYLFAFVMLGFQSIIYLGAESGFRTWYSIDAMTSANNMLFPYLMPLLAWCAAISEEAVYRLFAIPALKKIVRFTFPAILLSSMIWALGHVQYPVYPFYTRFVEVTLIGLAFAYIFLKHGFLTAVYAHAVVDIIWMGISITSSTPSVGSWTAFALYLATPAAIALAVRSLHRRRLRHA